MQTAECIEHVHRQSKEWRWWQEAAEDGEGDEKALEAFDRPARIQERAKDQVPDSDGKALRASHASSWDGKCPRTGFSTEEEAEVEEKWEDKAEERTAAVIF